MKENTISRKIKFTGVLFMLLMISIIATTIYLNEKNKRDALVINIAGKQRMLSQKISKNIFYLYYNNTQNLELEEATKEFISNLNSLKNGNSSMGIEKVQNFEIKSQILKVQVLWTNFHTNINDFKENIQNRNSSNEIVLQNIVKTIYDTNNILLNELDVLVSMYTKHTEEKTDYLRNIQYSFGILILLLLAYSFSQLKAMEANAKKFYEYSKKIVEDQSDTPLKPLKINAEKSLAFLESENKESTVFDIYTSGGYFSFPLEFWVMADGTQLRHFLNIVKESIEDGKINQKEFGKIGQYLRELVDLESSKRLSSLKNDISNEKNGGTHGLQN